MTTIKTELVSGKRRRVVEKGGRRFEVKEKMKKKGLPKPVTLPRKARLFSRTTRIMAFGAFFFVLIATISNLRTRAAKRRAPSAHRFAEYAEQLEQDEQADTHNPPAVSVPNRMVSPHTGHDSETRAAQDSDEHDKKPVQAPPPLSNESGATKRNDTMSSQIAEENQATTSSTGKQAAKVENRVAHKELPERIEWYTRDDYKLGTRPMCRISKPYILTNGTVLLPAWMEEHEGTLQRCGLGTHGFYTSGSAPPGLEEKTEIDVDFALTIHLEKFQEPTHAASVYLTEHILKASYLFDVFAGDAHPAEEVQEHHCYITATSSNCTLTRPVKALLKPGIFVPKHIEAMPSEAWSRKLVDMFGKAHGHGREAVHLDTRSIVVKSDKDKTEGLSGTLFRSIMTTDGMFRHLPPNSLQHSNFYSEKNGVVKTKKKPSSGCSLSIGIASVKDETRGIAGVAELRQKIEMLAKLAIADSTISVKQIEISGDVALSDHIKEIQDLDIYMAGSGDEMSSVGYLRSSSSVFELMPFGYVPYTHESLARALGIEYERLQGKPQSESFKTCIDAEIFKLRKRGKLSLTESPDWQAPLIKAWDDAVGEHGLSGKSNFDVLSAPPPVKNYHSRACAQKQKIEIDIDETARTIVKFAKEKCSPK